VTQTKLRQTNNWGKTVFLEFSRKEAVFGKINYSPFSFSLGPIYEQNMSEINFSTYTIKGRYWSIFVGSRSLKVFCTRRNEQKQM